MPGQPPTPHDHLFRSVFSQPDHAAGELAAVLPPAVAAQIDWPTLKTVPASFIDEELRGSQADLLFQATTRGRTALL